MRRIVAVGIVLAASLGVCAPAFASGVDQLKDTINNACQNVTDGPGSCPRI